MNKQRILLVCISILTSFEIRTIGCGATTSTGAINQKETNKELTQEYGNTEYQKTTSYLDFAGVEAFQNNEDAKVVKIAYGYSGYPISYTAEDGSASGYDIEVLKAVDALLPEYEFEFIPSAGGDDLLLGVQPGKFDGAVRNWFQTQ